MALRGFLLFQPYRPPCGRPNLAVRATAAPARQRDRRYQNVDGEFFVDRRCIDCDTCRWMAPETFSRIDGKSAVLKQPSCQEERLKALQALLSCPTNSIHTEKPPKEIVEVQKWNPGLSQVWSDVEDALLIGGLSKFGNESAMSKYVKIAATLNNKSVRDVALRCRWLNEKRKTNRRKPEDHHVKKLKDRKEKVIASHANASMAPYNNATYSERTQTPVVDFMTQQLLDENERLIQLISSNSVNIQSSGLMQIKHNAALLSRLMNNIMNIQHRMSQSAAASLMPPLPALKEGYGMLLHKVANMDPPYGGFYQ